VARSSAAFSTALPWFRFYTEFASDPKVQMLSEAMQRRFVMVLCLTGTRLIPTNDDAAIAFAMRISPDDARETKATLTAAGLIRDDWLPPSWSRRQFKSDHDATERKRRQRNRDGHNEVTAARRDSHNEVTTTGRDSHGTEERRGEGEQSKQEQRTPPSRPASRKYGDFETINDTVAKLIQQGGCKASDVGAIAKAASISERQARTAIRQLRDRGRV
jgi:hypothetical protein